MHVFRDRPKSHVKTGFPRMPCGSCKQCVTFEHLSLRNVAQASMQYLIVNTKIAESNLTCDTNVLRSVEVIMNKINSIYTGIYKCMGIYQLERSLKAYGDKDFTNAYNICKEVGNPLLSTSLEKCTVMAWE